MPVGLVSRSNRQALHVYSTILSHGSISDRFRTCRRPTSSFCTVAWQLARFQLTRRIARSVGDSELLVCHISNLTCRYTIVRNIFGIFSHRERSNPRICASLFVSKTIPDIIGCDSNNRCWISVIFLAQISPKKVRRQTRRYIVLLSR